LLHNISHGEISSKAGSGDESLAWHVSMAKSGSGTPAAISASAWRISAYHGGNGSVMKKRYNGIEK